MMADKIDQLRRAVIYGKEQGKRNLIVDLDVLAALLGFPGDEWNHRTPGPATKAMLEWCVNHPGFSASPTFQAFIDEWLDPATSPT